MARLSLMMHIQNNVADNNHRACVSESAWRPDHNSRPVQRTALTFAREARLLPLSSQTKIVRGLWPARRGWPHTKQHGARRARSSLLCGQDAAGVPFSKLRHADAVLTVSSFDAPAVLCGASCFIHPHIHSKPIDCCHIEQSKLGLCKCLVACPISPLPSGCGILIVSCCLWWNFLS